MWNWIFLRDVKVHDSAPQLLEGGLFSVLNGEGWDEYSGAPACCTKALNLPSQLLNRIGSDNFVIASGD